MSDAALRELERRAGEGEPEALAALIAARRRSGQLAPDALEVLRYLEVPGAGDPPPRTWRQELADLGRLSSAPAQGRFQLEAWPRACLLAAWLAVGAAVDAATDLEPRDQERLRSLWLRGTPESPARADAVLADLVVEIYERSPTRQGQHAPRAVHLLVLTGTYHQEPSLALTAFEAAVAGAGEEAVAATVEVGLTRWALEVKAIAP
ncbi:MAG: hypothetical protein AB7N76_07895 [Planctomycetota bacterium]